ncbi:hypothetical protein EZS27_034251 [termite gut metagenome]|uniref:ATPase AAA-type core domain-containing protein n=1 Tax=termite gut metagenome TaxID=433724 RepID=A0A5J4Q1A5_9ZZZZ
MTKNEVVLVNQIYLIFKRPLFSGQQCKKDVDGELSMAELSEGEQQLLTVLGLLKFTKDDESLILLDEPDTHLNPQWKWKYLDFLNKIVNKPNSTQIIFCTHDPLGIVTE